MRPTVLARGGRLDQRGSAGFGLAIVQDVVEAYGWTLKLDGSDGEQGIERFEAALPAVMLLRESPRLDPKPSSQPFVVEHAADRSDPLGFCCCGQEMRIRVGIHSSE